MTTDKRTLLLLGCGQLGGALGQQYRERDWRVIGARRQTAALPANLEALAMDFTEPASLSALAKIEADYIVITLTPGERSEAAYRRVFETGLGALLAALNTSALMRLLFTSSTSVYHQNDGSWVDEQSPVEPTTFSGRAVLAGEQLLRDSGLPVSLVRFGGIYGGPSLRLAERVRAGQCAPPEPAHYSNRIHREDCVRVLRHLVDSCEAGQSLADCYLAVDDAPAPIAEVHQWLAEQLEVAYRWDPAYQHMAGSKRGDNRRLRDSGFDFRYPDYRSGYGAVLDTARLPPGRDY